MLQTGRDITIKDLANEKSRRGRRRGVFPATGSREGASDPYVRGRSHTISGSCVYDVNKNKIRDVLLIPYTLVNKFIYRFNCDRLPFFLFFLVFLPCVFLASAAILTSLLFSFFPILMLFLNFSKPPHATLPCSRRHVIGSLQRCNLTVDDEKCLLLDILKWTHRFFFFLG